MLICAQDGEGNDTWAEKTCKCDCDSSSKLLSKGFSSSSGQEMDCMPGKKECNKNERKNAFKESHYCLLLKCNKH